ncbi:unnamed protein product [Caenorhabditis brenneri]
MQSIRFTFGLIAILGFAYLAQSHPLSSRETVKSTESTEVALPESTENVETKEVALPDAAQTTAIDTLGESNGRVKRQGGCGCCGCGYKSQKSDNSNMSIPELAAVLDAALAAVHAAVDVDADVDVDVDAADAEEEDVQRETRQIEQVPETVAPVETVEVPAPETVEEKKPEEVETATEWPEPVYELVTETWAH